MAQVENRGHTLRGHLDDRIRDAQHERERWEEQLEINAQLTGGDHKTVFAGGSDHAYFTSNHVENIVVTQTAVMTENAIRPVFVPRETNEPPEIFLRPESNFKVPEGAGLTDEQMVGAEQIPEALFDFLSTQTIKQEVDNPRAGETMGTGENAQVQPDTIEVDVPIFDDEDFIFVDDALCAEALTQEVSSEWEMCGADEKVRQCIYEAVALGWKDLLVQWNTQESHFEFTNLYPFNCWIDRWATSTQDAEYFVLRQIMPVAEALREYPEAEGQIRKHQSVASETNTWGGRQGGKYLRSNERTIVEIYTMWERHFPYPMEEQQALDQALVEPAIEEPLIDGETGEIADMGGPIVDEGGNQQYILRESGQATAPGAPNWPVRYGIRQVSLVGSHLIHEMELEAVDLPVARIRNIPVIESPYGEGEPQRLAEIQDLINRLWSIYHDYCLFYRGKEQVIPNSIYDQIGDAVSTMHSRMGRKIAVPDDLLQALGGNIIQTLDTPTLDNTFFQIMGLLMDQIDRISGSVEVLRGEAKSEWSGELFQQATSAARGPIGFKARHVSDAIKYASKIIAGYIIDFLPLDEWVKRNKKYPPQVLEVMRSRLKRIGYDVSVDVGGAASRETEGQRLVTLVHNSPDLLASPTFMNQMLEHLGIKDGEKIVREIQAARQPVE